MNNSIDFLAVLNPNESCLYEILSLDKMNSELTIILGCQDSDTLSKSIYFDKVSDFAETLPDKDEKDISSFQLPQTLIGFDYWLNENKENDCEWELLGSGINWKFNAGLPKVSDCKFQLK